MTTILRIFRKDLRHLWPHAGAVWILMALSAVLDPTYTVGGSLFGFNLLAGFALPLACWSLVIAVIHEEKLPGDRQYWLTRPYAWKQLLAAKGLFLAACINLPLFLWHVCACAAVGVPLWEHVPALLCRQFFFSAIYILPVAALASITRNLGQVVLTFLLTLVPLGLMESLVFARFRINWLGMEGYLIGAIAAIVVAGVVAILAIQYSRRATRLARLLAGALAAIILVVAYAGSRLAAGIPRGAGDSPIHFSLDQRAGRRSNILPSGTRDVVTLDIPLTVEGLRSGVDLLQRHISLTIDSAGRTWKAQGGTEASIHDFSDGTAWLTVFVPHFLVGPLGAARPSANVSGSAGFMAFGNRQLLPIPNDHSVVVPRIGVCKSGRDAAGAISLFCYTPDPRASVTIGTTRNRLNWIVPPGMVDTSIPTSSDFQPLMRFTSLLSYKSREEMGTTQLMIAAPQPAVEVHFDFPDVDLARYVVPAKR